MNDRKPAPRARLERVFASEVVDALVDFVGEELQRQQEQHAPERDERPFLTVAQYAERHQATPAAVRARIRRGQLEAIRPPGGREYLIPNDQAATITAHIEAPATPQRPGA